MNIPWWIWPVGWIALFGVWPWFDPGHDGETFLSRFDLALHVAATAVVVAYLWNRWETKS